MYAVEMQHITKRFENLTANDDVNFHITKGSIHALIGENGAGKSTLMRILYGFFSPDAGQIFVDGKKVSIQNPSDALNLKIGMVHQHFMLIPFLTVTENIILGRETTNKLGALDIAFESQRLTELSKTYRLDIDPNATIEHLSVSQQQRVEILKILYRNTDIILLDEPTPVLTPQEIDALFVILKQLKAEGKTIILITHKLSEVMTISDNVTVMRKGKIVGERTTISTNATELARLMIGEDLNISLQKSPSVSVKEVLTVNNLCAIDDRRIPTLHDISFNVKEGEIVGIAGVEGNGQSELVQVLAGLRKPTSGEMSICPSVDSSVSFRGNLAHIPEDRHKYGLILEFTLEENFVLGNQTFSDFSSCYLLRNKSIRKNANSLIQLYDIRPPKPSHRIRNFSGGNQQKAVVARELSKNAPLVIACQPTRGLDIRAIEFIHSSLIRQRNEGKAILLVTSDLSEVFKLSDRIGVMYEGRITEMFNAAETNERDLGLFMTGSKKKTA